MTKSKKQNNGANFPLITDYTHEAEIRVYRLYEDPLAMGDPVTESMENVTLVCTIPLPCGSEKQREDVFTVATILKEAYAECDDCFTYVEARFASLEYLY
jgi:hypothetical protein